MGAMMGVARENANGFLPTTSNAASSDETLTSTEKEKHPEKSSKSMATTGQQVKQTVKPKKMKSGNVLSIIEDIQRLPNEAIYEEFERLLTHTGRHFKNRTQRPCEDISEKLQHCLYQNQEHACKCFNLMEEYRQCVQLATQKKLDMPSDEVPPPLLPLMPPVVMPPAQKPAVQHQRHRWWKFWTWFR